MPRDLTPLILQSVTRDPETNDLNLRTQVAAEITLNDEPEPLYLATAALVMSSVNMDGESIALAEPISHVPTLRKISDIVFSMTSAPDTAEIDIEHFSLAWGPYFRASYGDLNGSEVRLFECFLKPDGTYEGDVIFRGDVTIARANTEHVTIPLVGDFSVKSAQVSRPITQRCFAREFEDEICGHTGAPPGSTCSFIKDDAEGGCRYWRWEFAFAGAPFMSTVDPATGQEIGAPTGTGGGGRLGGFEEPTRFRERLLEV